MTRGGETPVLGDERKQLLDQPGRVLLWDVLLWLRLLFGSGCTDTPCNLQQEEGLLPGANQYNDSRNLVHPASRLLLVTGLETAIFIPVYSWQQRVCSNCRGSSSMKDERAPICKATLLSSLSTIWESYVEYLVQFRVLMASGSRATVNRSHLKAVEGLESSLLLPRTVQRVLAGLDSCWVKIMEGRIGKAYCEEVVVRKKEAKGSPRALVWLLSGKNAGMWMWEKYHEATETTDWVVELERKYKARNA
ncbi:hypothetical protein B0H19DRAFT_1060326 [Mycena capillaripes]|nr:hypothetical protein B0H19DRAFT_1060326 [Mycena capillaripes]